MKSALPLVALLLAGCAHDGAAFPSLLPRAAERQGLAEPAVAAPAAAVGGKLDAIVRGFDADAARAERAAGVAGARTAGSEAWITAQTALAALDDWRAQAADLSGQTDDLQRARLEGAGTPYPALDALHDRTQAEATREAGRITALSARLPQS